MMAAHAHGGPPLRPTDGKPGLEVTTATASLPANVAEDSWRGASPQNPSLSPWVEVPDRSVPPSGQGVLSAPHGTMGTSPVSTANCENWSPMALHGPRMWGPSSSSHVVLPQPELGVAAEAVPSMRNIVTVAAEAPVVPHGVPDTQQIVDSVSATASLWADSSGSHYKGEMGHTVSTTASIPIGATDASFLRMEHMRSDTQRVPVWKHHDGMGLADTRSQFQHGQHASTTRGESHCSPGRQVQAPAASSIDGTLHTFGHFANPMPSVQRYFPSNTLGMDLSPTLGSPHQMADATYNFECSGHVHDHGTIFSPLRPTCPEEQAMEESLLKPCARALRAFGMTWSQNAMQARSWKAVSRMIDMYTQARNANDIVRWFSAMKAYGCEPTKVTFDSALEVYSHTGSIAGAMRWLQAMCVVGICPDEGTFRWAKRACTRANSVAEAEWCFNVMLECGLAPDVGAFTAVVNVCAHLGDVNGAERWFSAMHLAGIWPGAIAYNSVINAHAQAKDVAGAERWLSAMEASGILPNDVTFSSVIKACAQAADVPAAERWFERMVRAGFAPSAVPYNTVLNACARARDLPKAEEWLGKMKSAAIRPDQVSYNVMIKAHGLVGDAAGAEQHFIEMEQVGLAQDRKSFSALAMAFANARPVPMGRVEATVAILLSRKRNDLLSHDTVASLLQCCAFADPPNSAAAVRWFRAFAPVTHLNDRIEKALARAIGDEAAQTEVEALYRRNLNINKPNWQNNPMTSKNFMPRRFHSPGASSDVVSPTWSVTSPGPSSLFETLSPPVETPRSQWSDDASSPGTFDSRQRSNHGSRLRAPDSTSAGIVHSSMSQDVILEVHAPEDLHRYLIGTRGVTMRQIQHESGARIFFPTTRKTPPWAEPSGPDCITIVGAKPATARAKQLIAARVSDYYTGIGAAMPEGSPLTPDRETSVAEAHMTFTAESRAVGAQLTHGSNGQASGRTTTARPSTMLATTEAQAAAAPLQDQVKLADSFPSEAAIAACAKFVDAKGVVPWLDVMRESGLWVGRMKPSTCVAINACTCAKDANGVVQWYRAVQRAGGSVNEHTFNSAIKTFAYAGDIRGTESWISAMRRVGYVPNTASFNAVVNRFARAGDVRNAEKWLKVMQGAGSVPGQLTFNSIIQAYTLAADPAGATRWYEAMQAAKVAPNEKTFSSIINAHAQAKKIDGAEKWFEEMELAGFAADVVSFNTVINACAQVRDVNRAVTWLGRMRQSSVQPNQVTYNVMIKAHALSGDTAGAEQWFEEMRRADFTHNLRSFSSMATAYGQSLTVNLDKVKAMVDEMKLLNLHPDHEVLTSLLKCCAHSHPPNGDLAVSWFKEFVPKAHLLAHVERALRQACGTARADDVIAWARATCPQATAPRQPRRSSNSDDRSNRGGGSRNAAPDGGIVARKLHFEGEN